MKKYKHPILTMSQKRISEIANISKEDVKKIKETIKKFSTILNSIDNEFCIESRILWEELGKPQSIYANWIKRKIIKVGFMENKDYISIFKFENGETVDTISVHSSESVKNNDGDNSENARFTYEEISNMSPQERSAYKISTDYMLTLDCAKHVAMAQNNEVGKEIRDYFIKTDKMIRYILEYEEIRNPEKLGDKLMKSELDKYFQKNYNKRPKWYDYVRLSDTLNKLLFGYTAKDIKNITGNETEITRDYLTKDENEAMLYIQEQVRTLLLLDMDLDKMYDLLERKIINKKYPNIKDIFYKNHIEKYKK